MYEEESLMDYFDTDEEIALEENEEAADFDEVNKESLEDKTAAELQKMKIWLFSENVRIAAERKRLKDMEEQIISHTKTVKSQPAAHADKGRDNEGDEDGVDHDAVPGPL